MGGKAERKRHLQRRGSNDNIQRQHRQISQVQRYKQPVNQLKRRKRWWGVCSAQDEQPHNCNGSPEQLLHQLRQPSTSNESREPGILGASKRGRFLELKHVNERSSLLKKCCSFKPKSGPVSAPCAEKIFKSKTSSKQQEL